MPMIAKAPIAWAKTGKPQPGFNKTQLEWSFDLGITPEAQKLLEKAGVNPKYIKPCKNEKTGKEHTLGLPYIKFTRKEIKADGTPGKPYRIVDANGEPWPEGKQIGNHSVVNVKYLVNEELGKPNALAIQVWELAEYEGDEQFPTKEDDGEDW